jgi:muramoyltetrapeptide carboxypeptidase
MIFPNAIKVGDYIGVTAPSDGNKKQVDYNRLDNGIHNLKEKGFSVIETANVRTSVKGRSSDAKLRAQQLEALLENNQVKAIIAAKGGDYLVEMLSCLDFNKIKENPKWIQGYSDVTGLLFTITTLCDIATIYSNNFNDFGMKDWHLAVENNLNILQGNLLTQHSFDLYEDQFQDRETGLEGYVLEKNVLWKSHTKDLEVILRGRLLGGCLDVLLNLVGTRFDQVKNYTKKYKDDGILWFLESFDLSAEALTLGLWQLKEAGWFEHGTGFVFGRPAMFRTYTDTTYEQAVLSVLGDLGLPIIFDADIGHKAPQFTMVNGAISQITYKDGKGYMNMNYIG